MGNIFYSLRGLIIILLISISNISVIYSQENPIKQNITLNINAEGTTLQALNQKYILKANDSGRVKQLREFSHNPNLRNISQKNIGDTLILDFFEDNLYKAIIKEVSCDKDSILGITSELLEIPASYFYISISGDDISFFTHFLDRNIRFSVVNINGINYLIQSEKSTNNIIDISIPLNPADYGQKETKLNYSSPEITDHILESNIRIDVMFVYTPNAENWTNEDGSVSDINHLINLSMQMCNMVMENSNVGIRFNHVYSHKVNYRESNSLNDLERITFRNNGYMDEVHSLRERYGADLIIFLADIDFAGGVAWLLSSEQGNPEYAFSLCRVQQALETYTIVHEMAHNMGCGHHRNQLYQSGPGLYPYSSGYRGITQTNRKYATIMTYEDGSFFQDGETHQRIPYFSSPEIDFEGIVIGDTQTANNVLTLKKTKKVVSEYMESKINEDDKEIVFNSKIICLDSNMQYMLEGKTFTENIQWRSSNTDIFDISESGLIHSKSMGNAYVIAFDEENKAIDSCKVIVENKGEHRLYVKEKGKGYGASWNDASEDLQAMVNALEKVGGEIWVMNGNYYPVRPAGNLEIVDSNNRNNAFVLKKNVRLYGGFNGTEISFSQRQLPKDLDFKTVLNGDIGISGTREDNSFHVVVLPKELGTAEINGFTIKNGNADGLEYVIVDNEIVIQGIGGGIINMSESTELKNLVISDNMAKKGAGIFNEGSSSTMQNVVLRNNYATEAGGGLYNHNSELLITNNIIANNEAKTGGGIYNEKSVPVLTNITLSGNIADTGGGIYNNNAFPEVRNSIIWGNRLKDKIESSNIINETNSNSIFLNSLVENETLENGIILNENPDFVENEFYLLPESKAVSAGDMEIYAEKRISDFSEADTDIIGNSRILNGKIDLGAYQSNYTNDALLKNVMVDNMPANLKKNSTTAYEITIPYKENIEIMAEPINQSAQINGEHLGIKVLYPEQLNTFTIEVIAQNGVSLEHTLDIKLGKKDQQIIFPEIADKKVSDSYFLLDAVSTSGLELSYSSSDSLIADIVNDSVKIKGLGNVKITASQEGNIEYNNAEPVTRIFTIINDLGINQVDNLSQNIYPNPAMDYLYVKTNGELKQIEIYTIKGEKIITLNNIIDSYIDISNLGKGVYIIKIKQEKEEFTYKIIKA